MDISCKELTLDEFLTWKKYALQNYLTARGMSSSRCGGTKDELAALAFAAHTMQMPLVPSKETVVQQNKIDYKNLLSFDNGVTIQDPFEIHDDWLDEKSGIYKWPPVFLSDIIEYAGVSDNISIQKFLQQYKIGKGFEYVKAGFLKEIFYHDSPFPDLCFIRTQCTPSQRLKDEPHRLWACIKDTGLVKSAYCTCTAGLGGTCNHIAAMLFRIETAHRLGITSCTSVSCTWKIPSNTTDITPTKLTDLSIVKSCHGDSSNKRPLVSNSKKIFSPVSETSIDKQEVLCSFAQSLKSCLPNACIFKGIPDVEDSNELDKVKVMSTDATENSLDINQLDKADATENSLDINRLDKADATENSLDINNFTVEKCTLLTEEDVNNISKATVGQATNPNWHIIRKGRITSSNFYAVHTKVKSLLSKPSADPNPLLCRIMGYKSINENIKPLKYGREMEPIAKRSYLKDSKKTHGNVVVNETGIFIDIKRPYIASSPDLLVECCCGKGVVEIKCPLIPKCVKCTSFCLCILPTCLVVDKCSNISLKKNHAYYAQVQGQMAMTNRNWCDFYVYTCNGSFMSRIEFDKQYYDRIVDSIDHFYNLYVAPELLSRNLEGSLIGADSDSEPMLVDVTSSSEPTCSIYFCPVCKKQVKEIDEIAVKKDNSIACDFCNLWFHCQCVNLNVNLKCLKTVTVWKCPNCIVKL